MSNRDLLKEALADAKVVKEMAITNAKAALEEAFAPQLKNIVEKKIMEMDEDEDETVNEIDDAMNEDDALEELLRELEAAEEADAKKMHEAEEEAEEEKEEEEEGGEEETEEEEEDEEIDFDNMDEAGLEDFITKVVDKMIANGEIEGGHEGMEDEPGADMDMDAMDTDAGDVEDMETVDLDMDVTDDANPMMEAKKMAKKMMDAKKAKDKEKEEKEKKDKELEEAKKKEKELKKEMEEKEKSLKEALNTIQVLKSELTQINLLNSKLLYTNKIFKAKNLTESNKVKVLAAFDKAESVKEVKLVFETLSENLVKMENTITSAAPVSKAKAKELVRESKGFASATTGGSINTTSRPVVDVDPIVERMKKLAGLK